MNHNHVHMAFYAQKALDLRINIHLLTKQRPMPENLTGYIDQFP